MKDSKKSTFLEQTKEMFPSSGSRTYDITEYSNNGLSSTPENSSWIVKNAKPSKLPYLIYGLVGLGLIGGFIMLAPMIFTMIGYALGIAAGLGVLGFLWVMKEPMNRWARIQGIKAHRRIVESNPIEYLTLERNRAVREKEEVNTSIEVLNAESAQLLVESRTAKKRIADDTKMLTILKGRFEDVKTKLSELESTEDYDLKVYGDLNKKKQNILTDIRKLISSIKRSDEQVVKFGMESKHRKELADKFYTYALRHSDKIEQLSLSIKELQEDLRLNRSGARVTEIVRRLEEIGTSTEFGWSLDAAKEQINQSKAKMNSNIRSLDEKVIGNNLEHSEEFIESELNTLLSDIDEGKIGSINPDKYLNPKEHITTNEEFISSKRSYNDISRN